jgi:phosphoglycolate phosphatase-like HAD superfamily hydrolase
MEIKHKECFIPNIIKHWELQPISKFAREASEFVNLYSKWRGTNRFPALTLTFDLLAEWDEVLERKKTMPDVPNLRRWIETESKMGTASLRRYCEEHPDHADCVQALEWAEAVDNTVADVVHNLPPFPRVREVLVKASQKADCLVCSATPQPTLQREWDEHDISSYVFTIAGQEQGKKSEIIDMAGTGKYADGHIIMIGDAPGDLAAAKANDALFFPINPGAEAESWVRLETEALDRFFDGTYAGDYETALIEEFQSILPEIPRWKR